MQSTRPLQFISILTFFLVLFCSYDLHAQQNVTPPFIGQATPDTMVRNQDAGQKKPPTVYAHIFGGAGFSMLFSDDVKSVVSDDFGIGIGLPSWSYGLRCGYRNILQVEYNFGKSNHDFNNNSIIKSIPSEVIKMDYDTKEIQLKINPTFWKPAQNINGFTKAFFLVGGVGDVEWRDKNDDGFDGKSTILGVEYARISKHTSLSFSFKRYDIKFDETTLFGIPFVHETKAADYIFEIKIGLGLGT